MAVSLPWFKPQDTFLAEQVESAALRDTQAAAGLFLLFDTQSNQASTNVTTTTVTISSVPPNAILVACCGCGSAQTDTVSGATLGSFTNQARISNNGQASLFTIQNTGGTLTNEVITYNSIASGTWPGFTVYVFTGASTTFGTPATNTGATAAFSVSVTAGVTGSQIVGVSYLFNTATVTPDGNTTGVLNTDNGNGDHIYTMKRTNLTTSTGANPIGGTYSGAANWAAVGIEVRPA